MIFNPDIKIKTERITLQPVEDSYIDDIFEHFTNEVTQYMPFNPQGNRRISSALLMNQKELYHRIQTW